jgi:hypothetical protein
MITALVEISKTRLVEITKHAVDALDSVDIPAGTKVPPVEDGTMTWQQIRDEVEDNLLTTSTFTMYQGTPNTIRMKWGKKIGPDMGSLSALIQAVLQQQFEEETEMLHVRGANVRLSTYRGEVVDVILDAIHFKAASLFAKANS